jgi:YedE family putative selenium metabolism protein
LGGGDLNALAGVGGLAFGVYIGVFLLKRGFNLSRATNLSPIAGWIVPAGMVGVLVLLLVMVYLKPDIEGISFSDKSWGAEHAFWGLSLLAGLLVGFLAQKSRMCFMGAWRDMYLVRSGYLMSGLVAAFLGVLVFNLILGQFGHFEAGQFVKFIPSFEGQGLTQTNQLWNFMGMVLVGLAATMLGACPLRQLVMSGEGDTDAGVTVLGMFVGAALVRNIGASSCGGALSPMAPYTVSIGIAICLLIGFRMREK